MRYYQAVVLLVVALAAVVGIQSAIANVDTATIPVELLPVWNAIAYIFLSQKGTVLFTFLRNILGYAENWFEVRAGKKKEIQYEAGLLGATWTKYSLYVMGLTALVLALTQGTPAYNYAIYIAGAVGLIVDLITRAITKLTE